VAKRVIHIVYVNSNVASLATLESPGIAGVSISCPTLNDRKESRGASQPGTKCLTCTQRPATFVIPRKLGPIFD
jgi:hypothetical protein